MLRQQGNRSLKLGLEDSGFVSADDVREAMFRQLSGYTSSLLGLYTKVLRVENARSGSFAQPKALEDDLSGVRVRNFAPRCGSLVSSIIRGSTFAHGMLQNDYPSPTLSSRLLGSGNHEWQ
jgi:hypothetical protein